jgi:hypothetical protein
MKSAFCRTLAVVALVAIPVMAHANDASIGSEVANQAMSGATLMNTTAVFNAFPHMVVDHGTGVELDTSFGNAPGDTLLTRGGSGKIWWEASDGTWINMNVGRKDYGLQGTNFMWGGNNIMAYMPTEMLFNEFYNNFGLPTGGSPFADATWVNLGMARPTSGGGAWAANVQFALGKQSNEVGTTTDTENNQTGFGGLFSWGNGDGLDVSAEAAYQKAELKDNVNSASVDLSTLDFGVNGRLTTDMYIYQGNFVFVDGSLSSSGGGNDPSTTTFGVLASAGRYLKNDVDGQATAEFGLAWMNSSADPGDSAQEVTANSFAIPSVRISAWHQISNRFGLMGGVEWAYAMITGEDKGSETKTTDNFSDYDWSVGMYFQPTDNVRVDAQLRDDNLDHLLSLGNTNPLIAYLGATVGLN